MERIDVLWETRNQAKHIEGVAHGAVADPAALRFLQQKY